MSIFNNTRLIKRIKKHIYFNNTVNNYKMVNVVFHNTIVDLMKTALSLGDKEVLILLQNNNFATRKTTSYMHDIVYLTTEMEDALLSDNGTTFTAFHNHPDNGNISTDDINMLLKYEMLQIIVVVTNNCKYISLMIKTRKLCNEDKENVRKLNVDYCDKESIRKLEANGIYYMSRKNY